MRELATLPDGNQAQTLADYLLTLKISTRVDQQAESWVVWVCEEDQLAQARQEMTRFLENPTDSRYTAAIRTARALRRQEEQQEEDYRQKQTALRDKMTEPPATGGRRVTMLLLAGSLLVAFFTQLGEDRNVSFLTITPGLGPQGLVALERQLATGEIWRLITPIFLHFGIFHLLFNMFMLVELGGLIEESRGPGRFLLLVVLLAVSSNLAQYFFPWQIEKGLLPPSAAFGGMSGVVYGLFGYLWMKSKYEPDLGLNINPTTVIWLLGWFFLCVFGVIPRVANTAHAAGLVMGMLIGLAPVLWRSLRS